METNRFTDKICIVTGAAYGIGRATALAFAKEGAKLVVTDYNEEKLRGTCALLDEIEGCEYLSYCFDIRCDEKIDELIDETVAKWGRIDVLVNNAGIGQFNPFPTTDLDEWDSIIGINARAMYYFCRNVVPHMIDVGKGAIVNVTSVMGEFAAIAQSIYNTSKGAAKMLTQGIAKDCAPDGIRCNAVAPGMVQTGLTENMFANETQREWFEERIPMGRVGRPDEMAKAILFLASDDASYINGATLRVDGGMTCAMN